MEMLTKECERMTKLKKKEHIFTKMELDIKEIGLLIKCLVKD